MLEVSDVLEEATSENSNEVAGVTKSENTSFLRNFDEETLLLSNSSSQKDTYCAAQYKMVVQYFVHVLEDPIIGRNRKISDFKNSIKDSYITLRNELVQNLVEKEGQELAEVTKSFPIRSGESLYSKWCFIQRNIHKFIGFKKNNKAPSGTLPEHFLKYCILIFITRQKAIWAAKKGTFRFPGLRECYDIMV